MKQGNKIHCAACVNCKLFRQSSDKGRSYILLVRCSAGRWLNRYGNPRAFEYHTCHYRVVADCPDYQPACEPDEYEDFLNQLIRSLPARRIVHRSEK